VAVYVIIEKRLVFENIDQVRFRGVFVPGQPQNIPTKYTFGRFLRLVLLTDQMEIL
jgi:hypothetical protein